MIAPGAHQISTLLIDPEMKRLKNEELAQLDADFKEWTDNRFTKQMLSCLDLDIEEYHDQLIVAVCAEKPTANLAGFYEQAKDFRKDVLQRCLLNKRAEIYDKYPTVKPDRGKAWET